MKITNKKGLDILSAILFLVKEKQLESKSIVWLRNKRILNPIQEEYKEIVQSIEEKFVEEYKMDREKYESDPVYKAASDKAYNDFYGVHAKDIQAFLDEEKDVTFATFPETDIEKEKFNIEVVEILIDNIILV